MDDRRMVMMALQKGLVTREQVARAEQEQRALADRGVETTVWDLLLEFGHVNESEAGVIRKTVSSNLLRALEVDGYVIQGRIGTGGMGDVFRGRNERGEEAAVKLLSGRFKNNEEYLRRFDREARAAMRLSHPYIARCMGSGAVNGTRYLLMELINGPSLKAQIEEKGPIGEREALCLLEQMSQALGYAWAQGVLHRDVKPANIIVGPPRPGHDEPFCAKLIDFGLAKMWQIGGPGEESRGGLTGAGLALGTPHYMSPEQASGVTDLDQRCDIYGLGASLYHALMGETMYSGKNSEVIMFKQVSEELDLSELKRMRVRDGVIDLLGQMLVKNRNHRLATWDEVLAACAQLRSVQRAQPRPRARARAIPAGEPEPEPANLDGIRVVTPAEGQRVIGQSDLHPVLAAAVPPPRPAPAPVAPGVPPVRHEASTRLHRKTIPVGLILAVAALGVAAIAGGMWWIVSSL